MAEIPQDIVWPVPVTDFLAGNHLLRADILLCRGKSLFSKLIRWSTGSYFSHAALVFLVPSEDDGFNNTFVLEAIPTGVTVTNLRHYVIDASKNYDIAIKRVERPWFSEDVQRLVRGHMMDFVRDEYDFHAIGQFVVTFVRNLLFGARVKISGLQKAVHDTHAKGQLVPTRFVCSGFVQYGFIATVQWLIGQKKLDAQYLTDVTFNSRLGGDPEIADILATTPEDIAGSTKSRWMYVITGQKAYTVTTSDEVAKLLGSKKVW